MKVDVDVYIHDDEVQIQFDEKYNFTYERQEVEDVIVKYYMKEFEEVIYKDFDSSPYEITFSVDLDYIDKNRLYRIISENL